VFPQAHNILKPSKSYTDSFQNKILTNLVFKPFFHTEIHLTNHDPFILPKQTFSIPPKQGVQNEEALETI